MSSEAHRLISLSLGKISASRSRRGGVSLHRNLLVASVLFKARDVYLAEHSAKAADNAICTDGDDAKRSESNAAVDDSSDMVVPSGMMTDNDSMQLEEEADCDVSSSSEQTSVSERANTCSDSTDTCSNSTGTCSVDTCCEMMDTTCFDLADICITDKDSCISSVAVPSAENNAFNSQFASVKSSGDDDVENKENVYPPSNCSEDVLYCTEADSDYGSVPRVCLSTFADRTRKRGLTELDCAVDSIVDNSSIDSTLSSVPCKVARLNSTTWGAEPSQSVSPCFVFVVVDMRTDNDSCLMDLTNQTSKYYSNVRGNGVSSSLDYCNADFRSVRLGYSIPEVQPVELNDDESTNCAWACADSDRLTSLSTTSPQLDSTVNTGCSSDLHCSSWTDVLRDSIDALNRPIAISA